MARAIDTSLLSGYKTLRDNDVENALVNQKIAGGNVENMQKANIHATQMISAAAASGDQGIYSATKQRLADAGVDMSGWAEDLETGAKQAQAARLAQSPLGALLNAGLKAEGNVISATGTMGNTDAAAGLTPLSQMLLGGAGGGGILPGGGAPAVPRQISTSAISPPAIPLDRQPDMAAPVNDPVADFQGALAARQAANGVSPAQDPALASLGGAAPAQRFQQPPQRAGETNRAYMDRVNLEFEKHKADPSYLKEKNAAEKSGGALGDEIGETAKLVNIVTTNIPAIVQRFQNIRDAAKDASSGYGISPEGEGWAVDAANAGYGVGLTKTAEANSLLKQAVAQQMLPELGPALKQAGVTGNKFLEGISAEASGMRMDAPANVKIQLTDKLEMKVFNDVKAAAAQLRKMGQPAPTDAEIDDMVAQAKAALKQPALSPSAPAADAAQVYMKLRNAGYSDADATAYLAAKGLKK